MRAGGNPWLLRLAGAGSTCEVVLKTGDAAADLDRRQLLTTVAALELAAGHALPAPRLIAADLDGSAAGAVAVLMTVLAGSSKDPSRRLGRTAPGAGGCGRRAGERRAGTAARTAAANPLPV
jgi:hypothetical protein